VTIDNRGDEVTKISIHIEKDKRKQSFTNSCWEVQQVKSFKGGPVHLNGIYRFKHCATEMYLSLDNERLELTLREDPLHSTSTLFCFRSLSQE